MDNWKMEFPLQKKTILDIIKEKCADRCGTTEFQLCVSQALELDLEKVRNYLRQ